MKSHKFLTVAVLLTLSLLLTTFTWAYWSNSVEGSHDDMSNTITIGAGGTASTTVTVTGGTKDTALPLVPSTRGVESKSVEVVTITFQVKWDSAVANTATGTPGILTVTNKANTIGTSTDTNINGLVKVEAIADQAIIADGKPVTVTTKVTLTEPATKAIYDQVAAKEILSLFDFVVTP